MSPPRLKVSELLESTFPEFDELLSTELELLNYRAGERNDRGRVEGREVDGPASGLIQGSITWPNQAAITTTQVGIDVVYDAQVYLLREYADPDQGGYPIRAVGNPEVDYATDIIDPATPGAEKRYRVLDYRYQHNSLLELDCRELVGPVEESPDDIEAFASADGDGGTVDV